MALSAAGQNQWQTLKQGAEQVWQNKIYTFNSRTVKDGYYDLRLRISYVNSNYNEYFVRKMRVANHTFVPASQRPPTPTPSSGIYSPRSDVGVNGIVELYGSAQILNFLRWELYWSPGGEEKWTFLLSSSTPTANSLLARLDLSNLPTAAYDFRLRVINQKGDYEDYYLRRLLVEPLPTDTPLPPPALGPTGTITTTGVIS